MFNMDFAQWKYDSMEPHGGFYEEGEEEDGRTLFMEPGGFTGQDD